MRYLSVCSGIEAATVAWEGLGWTPAAFSEIERFPRAVLSHHYPDVPLHGDFTTIQGDEYGSVDLLVGGTPCQSFSVAGLRKGMDDDRGNLALEYLRLAARLNARWLVWENVPGVLSSNGGRDFGAFLGGLAELGYGWAYRVLDAQFFGVPQRRRRVFVVGYLGDWRRAAAVLFERESLSGHPAPSREAGEGSAPGAARSTESRGVACDSEDGTGRGTPLVPITFQPGNLRRGAGAEPNEHVTATLKSDHGRGTSDQMPHILAFDTTQVTNKHNRSNPKPGDPCHPLAAGAHPPAVAFSSWASPSNSMNPYEVSPPLDVGKAEGVAVAIQGGSQQDQFVPHDAVVPTLAHSSNDHGGHHQPKVWHGMAVRRITPTEAERLQGFPDSYTRIPYRGKDAEDCPDGPRYKALGNSMAVPVMAWIGERIARLEAMGGAA